jgi:gentisate 1,2-dioxygenase
MHRHASEAQIFILQGSGYGILNDQSVNLEPGDVVRVPIYAWHQLNSASDEPFIYLKNNSAGIYNRLSILMRDVRSDYKDVDISQFKDDYNIW